MVEDLFSRNATYINGEWITGEALVAVRNPATDEELGKVPAIPYERVIDAIKLAAHAFEKWKSTSPYERAAKLKTLASLLVSQKRSLARVLTLEQGKPLLEAEREIEYSASYVEWFAEEAKRVYGESIPATHTEQRLLVLKQPIGVCAAITPWNFPNAMITRKMAAALAAGCTFLAKPALETPFSALALAQLCETAGFPPGTFNVVTGDAREIARAFMDSELVRKVTFTGSTEVGKLLIRQSAETVKRLTMELGGNAPFIVFEDANLERAVEGALFGKFRNAGQTCICINRFLVHEDIASTFTKLLVERSKNMKVGNGLDPDVQIGPLISREAAQKICSLVQDALAMGASIASGSVPTESVFMPPLLLQNVTQGMRVWQEEIFGPVCTVTTFRSEEEALHLANQTNFGLASYFYTSNLSRAVRVAEGLEFGMVGVNNTILSLAQAPFGGIKHSGFGREGSHFGIEEYLNLKYIAAQII